MRGTLSRKVRFVIGAMIVATGCAASVDQQSPDPNAAVDSSAAASQHPIKFHRPVTPGYQAQIQTIAVSREAKVTRIADTVVEQMAKELRVELEAQQTTLEVDERGRPISSRFLVAKCEVQQDGAVRPIVAPGQVLTVTRADPPVVLVGDQPMSEEDVELIGLVINTKPPRGVNDDDIFGSTLPRSPGDAWSINSQLAAADLSEGGMLVTPESLQGRVAFEAMDEVQGIPCMTLSAQMGAVGFQLAGLPEGASMLDSDLQMSMRGCLPADGVTPGLGGETAMAFRGRLSVPTPSGVAIVEMAMERNQQELTIPIR